MIGIDCYLSADGWRQPIRPGAIVEVWDGLTLCMELDAAALLDILTMHVRTARLMALLVASAETMPLARERLEFRSPPVEPAPPLDATSPRKPLADPAPARGTFPRERRDALRQQRRERRKA